MTQTEITQINTALPSQKWASPYPQVHTNESFWDLAMNLARSLVQAESLAGFQANVQAVSRIDRDLINLRDNGMIAAFEIGGWHGDELQVTASMPHEHYTYENRMAVRDRIGSLLTDLGLYVDLSLTPVHTVVDGE